MSDPTQTATKLKQKTFIQDQRNMCYSLVLIVMELVAWSHASLDNSENVKCLPPTNFTIYEKHGKTFFWWSEFKEKDMDCNVTYKLQYRYLDTGNFSEIETEKTHYRKFLEFHKGVQARVKTVLQSATGEFTASDWTVANFTLSKGNFKVLVKNISCSVYNFDHFKCTWKEEDEMLTHAQYLVTLLYKSDGKFENRTCDTFTNKEEKVVGCHSRISSADPRIYLRINASGTDFYKIHIFRFLPRDIEKMDPPQNIKASIESGSLKIKWNQPRVLSITYNNSECFQYELKLNDSKNVQIQTIHERTSYNVSIIDAMRTYLLQLRGKKSDMCYTNNIWSDWSTIVVLNPNEGRNKLNSLVIALIVLGIPSVLLAVLLIFRCQRVLEKLFPPIPSPIIKNKNVLEKDTFFKTEAPKYIEEITIVVEDSSGDDRL